MSRQFLALVILFMASTSVAAEPARIALNGFVCSSRGPLIHLYFEGGMQAKIDMNKDFYQTSKSAYIPVANTEVQGRMVNGTITTLETTNQLLGEVVDKMKQACAAPLTQEAHSIDNADMNSNDGF